MTIAPGTRMTLEEFLAMPESEKPYLEFAHGEVWPKPMPSRKHGRLVVRLASDLDHYLRRSGEAVAESEVRHVQRDEERIFLPDISVTLNARAPDIEQRPMEGVPDFAIEVLSPDDRPGRVVDKIEFYLRNGVSLVWVVDPEAESVTVYRAGEPARTARDGDQLDAQPVLAAFATAPADIFAVLH